MFARYCPWHPLTPRSWLFPSRASSRIRGDWRTLLALPRTSTIMRLRMDMKMARFALGMSVEGPCMPLEPIPDFSPKLSATTSPWPSSWKASCTGRTRGAPSSPTNTSVSSSKCFPENWVPDGPSEDTPEDTTPTPASFAASSKRITDFFTSDCA